MNRGIDFHRRPRTRRGPKARQLCPPCKPWQLEPQPSAIAPFSLPHRVIPPAELPAEVLPLERELSCRLDELSRSASAPDLGSIERVAAARGFGMDDEKVGIDPRDGISLLAKSQELRVVLVAARPVHQDLPRQQRLAPQGSEPRCIEVSRMDRPEAHR